jgi:hypothetical protein
LLSFYGVEEDDEGEPNDREDESLSQPGIGRNSNNSSSTNNGNTRFEDILFRTWGMRRGLINPATQNSNNSDNNNNGSLDRNGDPSSSSNASNGLTPGGIGSFPYNGIRPTSSYFPMSSRRSRGAQGNSTDGGTDDPQTVNREQRSGGVGGVGFGVER